MGILMVLGGVLAVLCIASGAALLAVAIVILMNPRWYRERWGRPPQGTSSFNVAPFSYAEGKRRPSLYFWAGQGAAPYDPVDEHGRPIGDDAS